VEYAEIDMLTRMMLRSMMRFFGIRSNAVGIALAIALGGSLSCQPPPPATDDTRLASSSAGSRVEGRAPDGARRDLSQDEAAGGHILRKHVGQTDDELRERMQREPRITGASTYTDRATAEHAVGAAIAESQDRIQRWLSRPGGHPNLVLDYDSVVPVGRTINRGEDRSHPCAHALVVLKYSGPNNYYVLTSYPECRQ
jgi:Bacterial CdiA-CT RNAse A domain